MRLRQATLNELFARCAQLSSTTICLCCLCRPPEYMLGCGHSMCDTCISIFGIQASAEYHVDISQCPICLQPFHLTVRQLPPTKRPVIMTLDGGGVRGIVSLGLLQALEKRLGGVIRVSQIPDLVIGTSVGTSMLCLCPSVGPPYSLSSFVHRPAHTLHRGDHWARLCLQ